MSVSSSGPYPSPTGVVPALWGGGILACPEAAWLRQCLMLVWACSPLFQASAAPAVASSVAISAPAVLPLLSPPASAAPPAAVTWWWAPPMPAAPALASAPVARAVIGARPLQPLPARLPGPLGPTRTSRNRTPLPLLPHASPAAGLPRTGPQMCTLHIFSTCCL